MSIAVSTSWNDQQVWKENEEMNTGTAGPDHGSLNFKEEMGNPILIK